jgi:hypothetical protein
MAYEAYEDMFREPTYWEVNPSDSIFTGSDYALKGRMSEGVQEFSDMMMEYQSASAEMDATLENILALREEGRGAYEAGWYSGEPYDFYNSQVDVE